MWGKPQPQKLASAPHNHQTSSDQGLRASELSLKCHQIISSPGAGGAGKSWWQSALLQFSHHPQTASQPCARRLRAFSAPHAGSLANLTPAACTDSGPIATA